MSIFRHERLRVASGNGTLVQAPQTKKRAQEDFLSNVTSTENAEGGERKGEFVRHRNLRQVSKIAKGVRREIRRIFRLRNMCCQKWQHEKAKIF
jgi:hypothetical protein